MLAVAVSKKRKERRRRRRRWKRTPTLWYLDAFEEEDAKMQSERQPRKKNAMMH
jgi:aspartyl/asparaginyl beta-hydroxylase (cupin superfamily)